jgi:hypothetical protein
MLTFLALLTVTPEINRGYLYGSELLRDCTGGFSQSLARCEGYLVGVHDTVRAYEEWTGVREVCSPKKTTPANLRSTIVDYLSGRSDYLTGQAASVAVLALREKYPCTTPSPGADTPPRP